MKISRLAPITIGSLLLPLGHAQLTLPGDPNPDTRIEISVPGPTEKAQFKINGTPTYSGAEYKPESIGMLQNLRWVQATIDDTDNHPMGTPNNPAWQNLNSSGWDPAENTQDFIYAMDEWKAHGILSFTLNLQGGCQCEHGISGDDQHMHANGLINNPLGDTGIDCFEDWDNGITSEASDYLMRLGTFIQAADDRGMTVILGIFYFGQDQLIDDEPEIIAAVTRTVKWIIDNDFENVLLEIGNESSHSAYDHDILQPNRIHELVDLVHDLTDTDPFNGHSDGFMNNPTWHRPQPQGHMLTSVSGIGSFSGMPFGFRPPPAWIQRVDFVLLHANQMIPGNIAPFVNQTRGDINAQHGNPYHLPVIFNEDDGGDNTALDDKILNMEAAYASEASWGLYWDSYHQSPPFDPRISPHSDMREMARAFSETLGTPHPGDHVCEPAELNNTGSWGHMYAIGSDTISDNDLTLMATGMPLNTLGMFLAGQGTGPIPVGQGTLCMDSNGVYRQPTFDTGPIGCMTFVFNFPTNLTPITTGQTWRFQAWTRDTTSTGQATSNLTSAVQLMFQ